MQFQKTIVYTHRKQDTHTQAKAQSQYIMLAGQIKKRKEITQCLPKIQYTRMCIII